jgi:hypothetical protein
MIYVRMIRVVFQILVSFLIGSALYAQTPSVRTTISKTDIVIGEQFQYRAEALVPKNTYTFNWLTLPDSINHFEIVNKSKIDSTEQNGLVHYFQTLTITSFDSGSFTFPSFEMSFQAFNGAMYKSLTDSFRINVSYTPLDSTATFHDIKTIIEVKEETPLWIWLAIADGVLLLIVIILVIIKLIKRRKEKKAFTPTLSAYDEAVKGLKELEEKRLLEKDEVKAYHSVLVDIFKRYLSRTISRNYREQTTEELLIALSSINMDNEHLSRISTTLRMADAVKFAKYLPPTEDSKQSFMNIKELIEKLQALNLKSQSDY